jgi:hypothetical protein
MVRTPLFLGLVLGAFGAGTVHGQDSIPSIAEKTTGMAALDGFLPLYWDAGAGKVWLEVPALGEELIYSVALTTGVGSNDIGLDRGQLGGERIVRFDRVGPRVFLVQPNYAYRAESDNPDERLAVEEAFAISTLWGFSVAAETDGRVLVDASDFVLRDAHGVSGALERSDQGRFQLDRDRSAVYLPRTKAFPRNSEIEVSLTFTGTQPGRQVRSVTPTAEAITVRQRHSFIALPEPGYSPRPNDPRAGYFGVSYLDYATAIGQPMRKRLVARHRLEKQDPTASVSQAVEPIVYYLDRGTPEPVRSALLDGARWWNEAFEAIGFQDAYRVEMLPEGADPMDVRYNVIQWVHRSTRGWSYGSSVWDPRTGEIIKGHVSLGSLRVRQDYLLATGLSSPFVNGDEVAPELTAMALARLRQLAAHEVGHTLGLAHNFLASVRERASVMDYPHPLVTIAPDGSLDLSDAYDTGLGAWDLAAIAYGYQDFSEGTDEAAALQAVIDDARRNGLEFITDQDARPMGAAHPGSNLWDNGTDAAQELDRVMAVRRLALDRFGAGAIRSGAPWATLEEVLVPLYLHHRFQVDAAAKLIGGSRYVYAVRGDGRAPVTAVPADEQWRAVRALLATVTSEALALPASALESIPPRPYTYPPHRELFRRYTGVTFDAVAPAAASSRHTMRALLQPDRAARIVEQHALHSAQPGLGAVLDSILRHSYPAHRAEDGYEAELERSVERVVAEELMRLSAAAAMPQVRAIVVQKLEMLQELASERRASRNPDDQAHFGLLEADISRYLNREVEDVPGPHTPDLPPGSPIGG